jgi:glycerate 2-kinase
LIVAAGKAAAGMVRGAFASVPADTPALVVVPHGVDTAGLPVRAVVLRGGHPHPTSEGFESTARVLREAGKLRAGDTMLFLVSGGASAVLEAPCDEIDESDLVRAHELLVASGLAIADINLVRGCLSAVKAGRLAERARRARLVTLAISDVEGDDPRAIGSGPTVPPAASRRQLAAQAIDLLHAHGVAMPPRIAAHLAREARSGDDRAPGDDADVTVVASIEHARRGACAELEWRGYRVTADPAYLRGTTDAAAARVVSAIDAPGGLGRGCAAARRPSGLAAARPAAGAATSILRRASRSPSPVARGWRWPLPAATGATGRAAQRAPSWTATARRARKKPDFHSAARSPRSTPSRRSTPRATSS